MVSTKATEYYSLYAFSALYALTILQEKSALKAVVKNVNFFPMKRGKRHQIKWLSITALNIKCMLQMGFEIETLILGVQCSLLLNRIDTSVPIILKSIFWSEAVRLTAVVIKFRSRSGCIELIKTRSRAVCVYQEIYTKFIIPDSNQYSWRREEETSQVFCMIKDANHSIKISTVAFHFSWDANDDHVKHCCHQVSHRNEDTCQL